MPKTKNAYLRYLLIHSQIKRNKYKAGYPTIEDLWRYLKDEGLEVSFSTIEKDLCFLKNERGAPLEYDRKEKCYRYTEDWEFDVPLTPEAVRIIQMTLHKLEIFGEAQEFRMVNDAIVKLSDHFELVKQYPDDRVNKYILFEYTKGFAGKEHLSPIYEAIYEKRTIMFKHCRFETDEPTERTLQPYILKEHRNRWYVIGKENGKARIFGLDRLCDLAITDNYFLQEPSFYDEIFNVLRDAVGVYAFGHESEDVILHFSTDAAHYVRSLPLHRSQQPVYENETDGYTVKLHVKVTAEFINECILRFGDDVKVISPQGLAEDVAAIWQRALKNYHAD
jgi:predicted DNA-binding transcriptional regulator YafY